MNRRAFLAASVSAGAAWAQKAPRRVLILLGPPGAGKTTHSKTLSEKYKIPIVNATTLLKKSHGDKSSLSKRLKVQVEGGDLLGDQGLNDLFQARIRHGDCYNGFVLDGYPVNRNQAEFLTAQLKELQFPPPIVLHLQISDEISRKRTQSRGRADDKAGTNEQRLAEYHAEEAAVLGFFPASQVLHIDSSGTEREVFAEIEKQLAGRN